MNPPSAAPLWSLSSEQVSLLSHLDRRAFKQYGLAHLQRQPGWLYDLTAADLAPQPWSFSHMEERQGQLYLCAALTLTSPCPKPLDQHLFNQATWAQTARALQHYQQQLPDTTRLTFSPPYTLVGQQQALFLPPKLQEFLVQRRSPAFTDRWATPFQHPHWRGQAALSYSLAIFFYHFYADELPFSGDENTVYQLMLTARPIPIELKCPAVAPAMAKLINTTLNASQQTSVPPLAEWGLLDPQERRQLAQEQQREWQQRGRQQQRILDRQRRRKAYFREKKGLLIGLTGGFFLLALLLSPPLKKALSPPPTVGMNAEQVLNSYYSQGFNQLDPEWLDQVTKGKDPVLKRDSQTVTQLFVTSKIRQVYERINAVVPAPVWEANPEDYADNGLPFGAGSLEIDPLTMGLDTAEFRVGYTYYYPGADNLDAEAEPGQPAKFTRMQVVDLVTLQPKDQIWYLVAIDRQIESRQTMSVAADEP